MTATLRFVEMGYFAEAESALRRVAARCESGESGRDALLLMSAIHLDPRNTGGEPDSAALMAARYLRDPGARAAEEALAASLYRLALDRGADPGLRPTDDIGPGSIALRFADCDSDEPPRTDYALPTLASEPLDWTLQRLTAERDSLARLTDSLRARTANLTTRADTLEAELERVRRILRARPDTGRAPTPSR